MDDGLVWYCERSQILVYDTSRTRLLCRVSVVGSLTSYWHFFMRDKAIIMTPYDMPFESWTTRSTKDIVDGKYG